MAHFLVAERLFHEAASGKPVDDPAFQRRARWLVDITTVTAEGLRLAIEYDGAYWHADKRDVDEAKSLDLLAAGFLVVRLREHPLSALCIQSNRYLELTVHATAPDPEGVMNEVLVWASQPQRSQPERPTPG